MQIVYHCGVHGTDQDGLLKTLFQNRDWLSKNGIEAVSRSRHRGIFEKALGSLAGGPATREMEEMMLDAILENDNTHRVICSLPGFLGLPHRVISPNGLLETSGDKMAALANLFPNAEVEFFLALKNPATLVPYAIQNMPEKDYVRAMNGVPPETLRWGPAIQRMLRRIGDKRLVVWCHEDTPLIWPEVVRRIATMPGDVALKAGLQVLGDLLQPEGIHMIRDEMSKQERMTIATRREIFAAALQKYAITDKIEVEIDLPGWTQDLIDLMTEQYDEDVAEIAALPGVEFIAP
ncbi:hypothetical protein [Paracoccus aminophilus]|uniref:Uncharacterized protein n=1 Tax=Paracoccus aminophilus JCM 7686 TaxID=1367847 RepID=S5YCN9_PARAH|nr:hypothetical protein [Paracoccus aminophilus]AGT09208.1 hypothetical protein JCM7686_2127 [Paracoccus aminophilus JCM 7686]